MVSENTKYKIWFFGGGETRDNKFNVFTGSFISLMREIMGDDFGFVKGVYYNSAAANVIWTLNNCQKPLKDPHGNRFISKAAAQIFCDGYNPGMQLSLVASSSGSVVAAQTAVYLAEHNRDRLHFHKPVHLGLGSSIISRESELYKKLLWYQEKGRIGKIVLDDLLDADDNSNGTGGKTRLEAYSNAFGLMFPFLSRSFSGPSFLNTHPERGHVHRKRSQTVQKALDYIEVLLVRHKLAGDEYFRKASSVIAKKYR